MALEIHAAVSPVLLRRSGARRGHLELDVDVHVSEPPMAVEVPRPRDHLHRAVDQPPACRRAVLSHPGVEIGAVEQHHRTLRWREVDQGAHPHVPVEDLRSLGLERDGSLPQTLQPSPSSTSMSVAALTRRPFTIWAESRPEAMSSRAFHPVSDSGSWT